MFALLRGGTESSLNDFVKGINQVKENYIILHTKIEYSVRIILKIDNILYRYVFSI